MSLGPHRQSNYKLKQLPKCSRCGQEFVLVYASYGDRKLYQEWECIRCPNKIVKRNLLREQEPDDFQIFLANKAKELEQYAEENRQRDRRTAFKRTIRNQ